MENGKKETNKSPSFILREILMDHNQVFKKIFPPRCGPVKDGSLICRPCCYECIKLESCVQRWVEGDIVCPITKDFHWCSFAGCQESLIKTRAFREKVMDAVRKCQKKKESD